MHKNVIKKLTHKLVAVGESSYNYHAIKTKLISLSVTDMSLVRPCTARNNLYSAL